MSSTSPLKLAIATAGLAPGLRDAISVASDARADWLSFFTSVLSGAPTIP